MGAQDTAALIAEARKAADEVDAILPGGIKTVEGAVIRQVADALEAATSGTSIVTPCHSLPPSPNYAYEGRPYMQEQVLDGYDCPADGCYRSWDAKGVEV